jgi:uncharacterized protein (DUF2267 family)
MDFQKFAMEGNVFLKKLSDDLNLNTDTFKAGRLLRAALHTLRDCITHEESIQLISQLPMMLKAVYVDNWSTKRKVKIHSVSEFIEGFKKHYDRENVMYIPYDAEIFNSTRIILKRLRDHISEGEMEDIKAILPGELKILLEPEIPSVYKSDEFLQY